MRTFVLGALLLVACGSDSSTPAAATPDAGMPATVTPVEDAGIVDAGTDAAVDPCGSALLCETFESYPSVAAITNGQKFGPWQAQLKTGATMALDATHKTSGGSALHIHIDDKANAGGQLLATGDQPIFAGAPTHVYGRMMMYIDPNGASINWTFFGVSGKNADTGTSANGRTASYNLCSLANAPPNTYSFNYYLNPPTNGTQAEDCYQHTNNAMPTATWSCVSFELDSVARKLRMYTDGGTTPIASIDNTGQGCVAPTDGKSPWYGPSVTSLYAGAYSHHEMVGALDVWIDDLVVDTKPVSCPAH